MHTWHFTGSKPLMTLMEVLSGLSRSGHLEHVRGSGCYNFVSQCLQLFRIANHVTMLRSISLAFQNMSEQSKQESVSSRSCFLAMSWSALPQIASASQKGWDFVSRSSRSQFSYVFFGYHFNCHQRKRLWKPYLKQVKWWNEIVLAAVAVPATSMCLKTIKVIRYKFPNGILQKLCTSIL